MFYFFKDGLKEEAVWIFIILKLFQKFINFKKYIPKKTYLNEKLWFIFLYVYLLIFNLFF
jgi:hypothetical protein